MRDYDGYVKTWNTFGLLPDPVQEFVDFVSTMTKTEKIVELGSGNGLASAALAEKFDVTAVDLVEPIAQGEFEFKQIDGFTEQFFELLSEDVTLVARRTFCLFFSREWMDRLNRTNVTTIISEALDNERHLFKNAEIESKYLKMNGWPTVFVSGKLLVARRSL